MAEGTVASLWFRGHRSSSGWLSSVCSNPTPRTWPERSAPPWADVAVRTGRIMHPLEQFHAIASVPSIDPPDNGTLPAKRLKALCEALAGQTSTADSCFFCLWDGHGGLGENSSAGLVFTLSWEAPKDVPAPQTPFPAPKVLDQCKIDLPYRSYFLFKGPLAAASVSNWPIESDSSFSQSPNLFWPHDRAWCVASELDLFCTLVAGSEALAEALIADPRLEAWRVLPGDPITYDSHTINAQNK